MRSKRVLGLTEDPCNDKSRVESMLSPQTQWKPSSHMRLHDQVLSEEDFERLPPVLQRKYFSSLERLRLAKDANGSCPNFGLRPQFSRRPSSARPLSTRKGSASSAGSSYRSFPVSLPHTRAYTRPYLRKASQEPISPSTALVNAWEFAALPRAIQRKHFSPAEQHYIASRSNPGILDAADEALSKQYQQSRKSSSVHPLDFGFEDIENEDFLEEEEDLDDMDTTGLQSFRWLDTDDDLDLRLDDYHAISADLNNAQSSMSPHRRSFRRGLSFSHVSFRRRSSSSTSLQSPPPPGSSARKSIAPPALSLPQSRHGRLDSTASTDPSATHYQDPAAKMKLRVYLASPQKFDEALEFGFPSVHKEAVQSPGRPKTSPGLVNGQPKTFFADDTPSLSEDESRDERSDYVHQDSPRTPIDMSFPSRPSQRSSTDGTSHVRPRVVRDMADPYAHATASEREMTLRMTLTRPELRVLETTDHAKPSTVNDTPLEKAPLTVPVSDRRSIWGELPEEPSRMKRLFKKLKGRA